MRKWSYSIIALSAAALSIGTLHAQNGAPARGPVDVSQIEAGSYTVDAAHSMVAWGVDHLGFNDYFGIFGDVTGTLELDPANLSAAKVDVTIPIASVLVASDELKQHLLRAGADGGKPDFFGPNPEAARFVSTAVQVTDDDEATITGDLTLNGVTRPVRIEAELSGAGTNGMNQKKTVGFHGEAEINRSDFGIEWGIPFGIGDKIDLEITIAFEKN